MRRQKLQEKKYVTINVPRDTYSKAIVIGEKHGIRGSWVVRAFIAYFLKNRPVLKLLPTEKGKKVYPVKMKKEMKREIKAVAKEMNIPVQQLVDLIFLNLLDKSDEVIKSVNVKEMKLPKGLKTIKLIECFEKGMKWWEAACEAGSSGMYALKMWKIWRKKKYGPDKKKEKRR